METRKAYLRSMLGKKVHVQVDRPIGHVHKGMIYPVNYGFLPGTLAGDGQEQDAYILGITEPVAHFDGVVIGGIWRLDDVEDKLVVAPEGMQLHQGQIAEAVAFQEQHFQSQVLPLYHKSCGVLPWREVEGETQYLLVFEQFSQCWSLPKGHMEAGETEEATAMRELLEETGLICRLDMDRRATITYPVAPVGEKQVVFFLGHVSGTPRPLPGEIETYRWVTEAQLKDHLFPDTVAACEKLIKNPLV